MDLLQRVNPLPPLWHQTLPLSWFPPPGVIVLFTALPARGPHTQRLSDSAPHVGLKTAKQDKNDLTFLYFSLGDWGGQVVEGVEESGLTLAGEGLDFRSEPEGQSCPRVSWRQGRAVMLVTVNDGTVFIIHLKVAESGTGHSKRTDSYTQETLDLV